MTFIQIRGISIFVTFFMLFWNEFTAAIYVTDILFLSNLVGNDTCVASIQKIYYSLSYAYNLYYKDR
jgi:hypothetical protein